MTRPADADDGRDVHWPYPGWPYPVQPSAELEPQNLPPPRFAVGDRVTGRWGDATVIKPLDWGSLEGSRAYLIKHDWADGPPTFGHEAYEDDLQPGQPRSEPEPDEPSAQLAQLEMF